jgi:probable HAF family extracellular repeat protein
VIMRRTVAGGLARNYERAPCTRLIEALTDPSIGTEGTYAFGVNNSGDVVGMFGTQHANGYVYYSHGTYQTINDPLGTDTWAFGINNKGDIVGTCYIASQPGNHGFIYSHGQYTTISDPLGGTVPRASTIMAI